jgi:hypothetical protein
MDGGIRKRVEAWATAEPPGREARNCCRKCSKRIMGGRCRGVTENSYDPIKGTKYFHPFALYVRRKQASPDGGICMSCQYFTPVWWVRILGLKYD